MEAFFYHDVRRALYGAVVLGTVGLSDAVIAEISNDQGSVQAVFSCVCFSETFGGHSAL